LIQFQPVNRYLFTAILLFLLAIPPSAFSALSSATPNQTIQQQREWFKAARRALKRNKIKRFTELRLKLEEYPLAPYLDIWLSRKRLNKGSARGIEKTLSQYADVPESHELRLAWIRYLAGKGKWSRALQEINGLSYGKPLVFTVQLQSLWHIGRKDDAASLLGERWLRGERIRTKWRRVFSHWKKMGHPSNREVWERIRGQMTRGRIRSARKNRIYLGKRNRAWLKRWLDMRRNPEKTLRAWRWRTLGRRYREYILIDGLKLLAQRNAGVAWKLLARHKGRLSTRAHADLQQYIALYAARQHLPNAASWLARIRPEDRNSDAWQWQIRSQLLNGRWLPALKTIQAMPERLRKISRWRYWQARTLFHAGRKERAISILSELAKDRGYYSFLSAERLGQPFEFSAMAYAPPPAKLHALAARPNIRRAHEWLQLTELNKAVREWHAALSGATEEEWKVAASLASSWKWYDQAIRAAYRGMLTDFLELRFPLQYQGIIKTAAKKTRLSPSWILAIIRQESAFNPYARSRAGAMGLMQLMPRTGRQMARKRKIRLRSRADLLEPKINIRLGSAYLAKMLDRYNGHLAWAAAAYNAGPHRVDQWLSEKSGSIDPEALIEAIPFSETRRYVQQVLAFAIVYDWQLKRNQTKLANLL